MLTMASAKVHALRQVIHPNPPKLPSGRAGNWPH